MYEQLIEHLETLKISDFPLRTYYYIMAKHFSKYKFLRKTSIGRCDECVHLSQQRLSAIYSSPNDR